MVMYTSVKSESHSGVGTPEARDGSYWDDPSPLGPALCYLATIAESSQERACRQLGDNPYYVSWASWMQENMGSWAHGHFSLLIGPGGIRAGRTYFQAHVEPVAGGMTVAQLIAIALPGTRLGAVQTPVGDQLPSGDSLIALAPPGGVVVEIPFSLVLAATPSRKRSCFDPRASETVKAFTKYFESVTLLSYSVTATVSGGQAVILAVGLSTSNTAPKDVDGVLGMPVATMFSGSLDASSTSVFTYGDGDRPFGDELKAAVLGNPTPVFHLYLDGENGIARIRVTLRVRAVGRGVPSPVALAAVA